jgi:hypothetical protein
LLRLNDDLSPNEKPHVLIFPEEKLNYGARFMIRLRP